MVFHDIDRLTDIVNSHRIIIYYIVDDTRSKQNLCDSLEMIMDMLDKKNDDLIMFKFLRSSADFDQFSELYRPKITALISLFAIKRNGIPIICENIDREFDIPFAIKSLCESCKLNSVSEADVTNVIQHEYDKPVAGTNNAELKNESSFSEESSSSLSNISTAELQIRLPDGNKHIQKFDKYSVLQDVCDEVRIKYNLKEFYLKTYKQVFLPQDYGKTLEELDLIPNGVIIVVSKNVAQVNQNGGFVKTIFWMFMIRTRFVFNYFQGIIFWCWSLIFPSDTSDSNDRHNAIQNSSSTGQSGLARDRKKFISRNHSNIHTLHRNDDSDDENNRYNGNSTQQK